MMAAWTWLVGSRFGRGIGAVVAAMVAVLYIFHRGKSAARDAEERRRLEEYRNARKRADQAARDADGDTADVDDRLRKHGNLRDGIGM